MTNDTAQILASCLDAIEQRGLSLEECVAQHPDHRAALSELLPVAQTVRSAPAVLPSLDFRLDARQRLLARLPARRSRRAIWFARRAMFARVALILLGVVALATSVVTASAQALPDDVLYPMKRVLEQVRLALAADNVHGSDLRLTFAAERLNEVERLIAAGRGAETAATIDDFAAQIQSVVSLAQSMPDTTERATLIARVAESIKTADAVLATTQAHLPESAQVAVTHARAVLAERQTDLRGAQPSMLPIFPIDTSPDHAAARRETPALPGTSPSIEATPPVGSPPLMEHPITLPTYESTPRPPQRPAIWPTRQAPRVTRTPPFIMPTTWPPSIPTFEPWHFPTRTPRQAWPGYRR